MFSHPQEHVDTRYTHKGQHSGKHCLGKASQVGPFFGCGVVIRDRAGPENGWRDALDIQVDSVCTTAGARPTVDISTITGTSTAIAAALVIISTATVHDAIDAAVMMTVLSVQRMMSQEVVIRRQWGRYNVRGYRYMR